MEQVEYEVYPYNSLGLWVTVVDWQGGKHIQVAPQYIDGHFDSRELCDLDDVAEGISEINGLITFVNDKFRTNFPLLTHKQEYDT